jgi:hypothetical protein
VAIGVHSVNEIGSPSLIGAQVCLSKRSGSDSESDEIEDRFGQ